MVPQMITLSLPSRTPTSHGTISPRRTSGALWTATPRSTPHLFASEKVPKWLGKDVQHLCSLWVFHDPLLAGYRRTFLGGVTGCPTRRTFQPYCGVFCLQWLTVSHSTPRESWSSVLQYTAIIMSGMLLIFYLLRVRRRWRPSDS